MVWFGAVEFEQFQEAKKREEKAVEPDGATSGGETEGDGLSK
jgi:hypothetical protein